jgi:tetratricopeptide (TPR) repeat protein
MILGVMASSVAGCGSVATSSVKRAVPPVETGAEAKPTIDEAEAPSIARDMPAADTYERLGDTYARQGNRPLALLQYDRALKAAPRHTRVRHKKYVLYLADGLHADAVAGFRALVRDDPHDAQAWEGLGRALLQEERELDAEEALRQAVQEDARLWRAHALLGWLYEQRREYGRAVTAYRTALELKPDRWALRNNLGHAYFLLGDYRRAIEAFESAKAQGYAEAIVQNNLGLALAKTGAYREALAAFRLGGTEAHAFTNLGLVYLEAGQTAHAVACFQKAIDANPQFDQRATEQLAMAQSLLRKEGAGRALRPEQGGECLFVTGEASFVKRFGFQVTKRIGSANVKSETSNQKLARCHWARLKISPS